MVNDDDLADIEACERLLCDAIKLFALSLAMRTGTKVDAIAAANAVHARVLRLLDEVAPPAAQ